MAVIVGLMGVLLLAPLSVQVLATGQLPSSTRSMKVQDAIEASHAGLSDYVNHLQGPYTYLTRCSTGWDSLTSSVSGSGVTSLAVDPIPTAVNVGDKIQIGSGSTAQTVTAANGPGATPAGASGSLTIYVSSFSAATTFSAGTPVFDMTTQNWATTWTCPSGSTRDPSNPAFANYPNDTHWAPVHNGTTAWNEAFQYVVNSATVDPKALGAQGLTLYVTGRAGVPGSYVYETLQATVAAQPLLFDSNTCSSTGYQITVPGAATSAEILLWGAQGGSSAGVNTGGSGGGGDGDFTTLWPPVHGGDVWTVDPGAPGANGDTYLVALGQYGAGGGGCSGSMANQGGQGGHNTGAGVLSGNGGGGGGASTVCFGTVSQCSGSSHPTALCTATYSTVPCLIAVAGGGGGQGGLSGGQGGFRPNDSTGNGATGNGLVPPAAAGGTYGGATGSPCTVGSPGTNLPAISLIVGGGGGGGGGGFPCGGGGGGVGGALLILGLASSGGGGGAGSSSSMPAQPGCGGTKTPISGYPVKYGGTTYGSGGDGVVVVAFYTDGCPGTILEYQATVKLVLPVAPNSA
jgi:hypothetical protein